MNDTTKDRRLNIRITKRFEGVIPRLRRAANITGEDASWIVRQAIKEKLDRLAEQHPEIDQSEEAIAA